MIVDLIISLFELNPMPAVVCSPKHCDGCYDYGCADNCPVSISCYPRFLENVQIPYVDNFPSTP